MRNNWFHEICRWLWNINKRKNIFQTPFALHLVFSTPRKAFIYGLFRNFFKLFELAWSSLILVISMRLSILFYIDIPHLFHTLFFVSHIFSTNPVPLHFSLLCVVPMACRLVYYSENNHLIVCKSIYGNYNLRTMFLQLEILRY